MLVSARNGTRVYAFVQLALLIAILLWHAALPCVVEIQGRKGLADCTEKSVAVGKCKRVCNTTYSSRSNPNSSNEGRSAMSPDCASMALIMARLGYSGDVAFVQKAAWRQIRRASRGSRTESPRACTVPIP